MSFALITGASKGIGKAIAHELASRKFNVLLVARSEVLLQQLANEIRNTYHVHAEYLALDLCAPHAAQKIHDWCKQGHYVVNILVNNAGYGLAGKFEIHPPGHHLDLMKINMTVPVELISLFLPELKQKQKAYILNIASSSAYQSVPYLATYSASKAFILSFSRSLHYELKKSNVSVTVVSPGPTDTDFPTSANVPAKGQKAAKKVHMTAQQVAKIAVSSMFKKKTEVITGFINRLGAFFVWLLPKKIAESTGAGFYE